MVIVYTILQGLGIIGFGILTGYLYLWFLSLLAELSVKTNFTFYKTKQNAKPSNNSRYNHSLFSQSAVVVINSIRGLSLYPFFGDLPCENSYIMNQSLPV